MLKVRLQRIGKKGQAYFRVVVTEHTTKPKGKYLELLGSYDPHMNNIKVKVERLKHWLGNGAKMSPTVNNLLVGNKIIEGKKVQSWKARSKKKEVSKKEVKTASTNAVNQEKQKTVETKEESENPPVEETKSEETPIEENKTDSSEEKAPMSS